MVYGNETPLVLRVAGRPVGAAWRRPAANDRPHNRPPLHGSRTNATLPGTCQTRPPRRDAADRSVGRLGRCGGYHESFFGQAWQA